MGSINQRNWPNNTFLIVSHVKYIRWPCRVVVITSQTYRPTLRMFFHVFKEITGACVKSTWMWKPLWTKRWSNLRRWMSFFTKFFSKIFILVVKFQGFDSCESQKAINLLVSSTWANPSKISGTLRLIYPIIVTGCKLIGSPFARTSTYKAKWWSSAQNNFLHQNMKYFAIFALLIFLASAFASPVDLDEAEDIERELSEELDREDEDESDPKEKVKEQN